MSNRFIYWCVVIFGAAVASALFWVAVVSLYIITG